MAKPKGGVRNEVCRFMPIITPNHTMSTSRIRAAGAISGMTMKAISKKSMKKPRMKIARFATMSRPIFPPGRPVSRSSIQMSP